jgi:hypothetical protein
MMLERKIMKSEREKNGMTDDRHFKDMHDCEADCSVTGDC